MPTTPITPKFGIRNWQGGGRSSARETIGRVAAGAIARKLLSTLWGIEVNLAFVPPDSPPGERGPGRPGDSGGRRGQYRPLPRCGVGSPHDRSYRTDARCRRFCRRYRGSSGPPRPSRAGGSGVRQTRGLAGSGHALVARGSGVRNRFRLFQHPHDRAGTQRRLLHGRDRVRTRTNRSGGVQGGISNGEDIVLRVAFKPTATVKIEQETVDRERRDTLLAARGRHDPCVLPRRFPSWKP